MKSNDSNSSSLRITRRTPIVEFCVMVVLICSSVARADDADVEEANRLIKKRDWTAATLALKRAVKDDPSNSRLSEDLAKALLYSGRREEALSVLENAIQKQGGSHRESMKRKYNVFSKTFLTATAFQIYQDGLNLLLARKFKSAREKFEKALEKEPQHVEILLRIGQSLVLDSDNDSAAERLRQAKKLNAFEPEIQLWLGRALHQRGEMNLAIQELKSAQSALGHSEMAAIWYSEALFYQGQKREAISFLERDLKNNPLHLLGLTTLAKMRLRASNKDLRAVWQSRKDLQVALSRMDEYTQDPKGFEGELGLDLRVPSELKTEIQTMLQTVESDLNAAGRNSSG